MNWNFCLIVALLALFSGCITDDKPGSNSSNMQILSSIPYSFIDPNPEIPAVSPETVEVVPEQEKTQPDRNSQVAVEVSYQNYVDWFMKNNLFIRAYIPGKYVCGQYTVDMISDSERAGYKAYFAVITYTDSTGHALVSFKSTVSGISSWYFIEPQTNQLITTETLAQAVSKNSGKTVTEVNIYSYFDDAGDKDPTTWRFDDLLFSRKY